MRVNTASYLYTYANSSQYYFRIRLNFLNPVYYHSGDSNFIKSLRTSDAEEAQWLALFIKRNLIKEFGMDTNIGKSNIYNLDDSSVNEPNVGSANKISFTLLRNNINVRFGELLKSARDFFTDSTEPSPPALHPSSFEQNTTELSFASEAGASNLHSDASKVLLSGSKVPQSITDQPINESLSASIASTKLEDGIQNSVIATLMDEMAILQQQVASLISAQKPCDRAPPLPSVTDVHQTPLKAPKPVLAERVEKEQVEHHFSVSTQFELFMLEQEPAMSGLLSRHFLINGDNNAGTCSTTYHRVDRASS
jgi:hypothetical protein